MARGRTKGDVDYDKILQKWNISYELYDKWVSAKKVVYILDQYKQELGIETDRELAEKTGILKQIISATRSKARKGSRLQALGAITLIDALGIDPRVILVQKVKPIELTLNPYDALFLDSFPSDVDRANLMKYKNEILSYLHKLVDESKKKNIAEMERYVNSN
ncbi:hypothetical protein SELR_pSRC400590 (plasmid) [Selenomonas ruminantium subsp. lactilytica TAM6421]|uniref:Uncharacterized protein n=1 Tax=Selenomonas ruminantium subsp. lactilytica (strain NBRC 103574 / TAM6421) TaxID=927704 RepID=I0GVC3_SELRL|nr:hypothetical protein [Selenomonas ruminantium]BAL84710.1 hypothetical protein SELR_pSRC400590 [Selenomonas ruminantium subsp. lactilytica TAM6421]